jgi:hypothetical protein
MQDIYFSEKSSNVVALRCVPQLTEFNNIIMPPPTCLTHLSNTAFNPSEPQDETWQYFRWAEPSEPLKDSGSRRFRHCLICVKGKYSTGHKANARSHLRLTHRIHTVYDSEGTQLSLSTQSCLEDGFARQRLASAESVEKHLKESFNRTHFLELQSLLLIRRRLPFRLVTWPEYRALLQSINPAIKQHLVSSPTTIIKYIKRSFIDYRDGLVNILKNARSMIHFTSDMWSSPNRLAFLGVTAQWVDEQYTLRSALLALINVQVDHSGHHQAGLILDTIRIYQIQHNLGYYVGDNASSNNTLVRSLSQRLHDEFEVIDL